MTLDMPKLDIEGQTLWYDVHGTGEHAILLIPGAIGTGQSDFHIQLDSSNPNCFDFERFTIVCVELAGWGRSSPPKRTYGPNVLSYDADCCVKLMQHLGYSQFSLVGWSDGAKVCLVLAHKYASIAIRSIVLQGIITYASDIGIKHILWSRNLDNWDPQILNKYVQAYDGDLKRVEQLWDTHITQFIKPFADYFPNGILGHLEKELTKIKPPTLVLHGNKDFFVESEHPEHVARYVPNCQLVHFEKEGHNLHQTDPQMYKQIVERFLSKN